MPTKEQTEAILRFAESQTDALLPYPTADKIIEEVLANGKNARESVMLMLLDYLKESHVQRQSGMNQLKKDLNQN